MTIETNELPSGLSSTARRVDGPKTYTIGDLAREFGVTLRTLRFYEDAVFSRPGETAPLASMMPAIALALR